MKDQSLAGNYGVICPIFFFVGGSGSCPVFGLNAAALCWQFLRLA